MRHCSRWKEYLTDGCGDDTIMVGVYMSSNLAMNRCNALHNAIDRNANLFFIDLDNYPDHASEPMSVSTLVDLAGRSCVMGVQYQARGANGLLAVGDADSGLMLRPVERSEVVSTSWVGMGSTLILVDRLPRLMMPYFIWEYDVVVKTWHGEDVSFCRKVRDAGGCVTVAPSRYYSSHQPEV